MNHSIGPMAASLRTILAAGALALGAMACGSNDSGDGTQTNTQPVTGGALSDPNVVTKLHDMALQAAASSAGEPSTLKMYAVAVSDHQVAETALGSTIYDHVPVFVIVVTGGRFTGRSAPYGAALPEGTVLTLTVDAATYDVTDVSIGNIEPDLSEVASATVDLSAQ
jgi:hypothetical protein